jgi:hypothetical protein
MVRHAVANALPPDRKRPERKRPRLFTEIYPWPMLAIFAIAAPVMKRAQSCMIFCLCSGKVVRS